MKSTVILVCIILCFLSGCSGENRVNVTDEPILDTAAQEQVSHLGEQPQENTVEPDLKDDLYITLDVDKDGNVEHILYDGINHAIQIMRQDEVIWSIPLEEYVTFGYSHRGAVNHYFDFATDGNEKVYLHIYTTTFMGEQYPLGVDGEPDITKALIRYIRAHEYYLSLEIDVWTSADVVAYTWVWDKETDSQRNNISINNQPVDSLDNVDSKYSTIPNSHYAIPYPADWAD